MFEFFKRLVSSSPRRNDDVVLLVDLPELHAPPATQRSVAAGSLSEPATTPCADVPARTRARRRKTGRQHIAPTPFESALASHRARLLAMRLEHLNLCPPTRCSQLAAIGIITAGDLVYSEPVKVAATFRSPERAERAIRRYRAAIKLALGIESMMPRDALLLVAIHRRSVASVARESAAQLHRDLERFSLSSRGSKLIGGRNVPSLRRVKSWVASCREMVEAASARSPQMARQAA
ncbi:hypothetical protein CA85_29020 [Allorhodopirellula solitaria]|uniref:DUF4332 domain-containing protein n=2 Tax=Allorhodopirellula solitaria TaxID=2527987 RepID=A0A5C5XT12_9BACT|nr:hypothetical protein CA85_29020 [Allorhodopirellula solitaria]